MKNSTTTFKVADLLEFEDNVFAFLCHNFDKPLAIVLQRESQELKDAFCNRERKISAIENLPFELNSSKDYYISEHTVQANLLLILSQLEKYCEKNDAIIPPGINFLEEDQIFDTICDDLDSYCQIIDPMIFEDLVKIPEKLVEREIFGFRHRTFTDLIYLLSFSSPELQEKILSIPSPIIAKKLREMMKNCELYKTPNWKERTCHLQNFIMQCIDCETTQSKNFETKNFFKKSKGYSEELSQQEIDELLCAIGGADDYY